MGRDGNGNAWKHRQWSHRFLSDKPRQVNARKLADKPQFTLEELYITPFRSRRRYSEDGVVSYVPVERRTAPTGIHIFDAYLQYLAGGNSDLDHFAQLHGLRRDDIDSLVFVLTGMRGVDFRLAFQVRMADELLRYTALSIAEVSRRSGLGSANNLYLTFKREYNLAPGYRRNALRKQGDVGRFRL